MCFVLLFLAFFNISFSSLEKNIYMIWFMACLKKFIQIIVKTLDTRRRDFFPSYFVSIFFFSFSGCFSFILIFHLSISQSSSHPVYTPPYTHILLNDFDGNNHLALHCENSSLNVVVDRPTSLEEVTDRKHQIQNCSHVHDRLDESLLFCQGRKFNYEGEQRDDEENEWEEGERDQVIGGLRRDKFLWDFISCVKWNFNKIGLLTDDVHVW